LGQDAASLAKVNTMISSLNAAFAPIGVSFSLCEVEFISNFKYFVFFNLTDEPEVNAMYNDANMINIYCPDRVFVGNSIPAAVEVGGYSPLGGSTSNNTVLVAKADSSVAIHELGHFFGLYHTFEDSNGLEYVNGSNCTLAGDLICDTEADFNGKIYATAFLGCNYIGNLADGNGDPYSPMISNFMSYSPCACKFTRGQYVRMIQTYYAQIFRLY
jgi:hypothetical protein